MVFQIVTAYSITPVRTPPLLLNPVSTPNDNQKLLNTLLSSTYNEAQFPERLEILTAALQQMPPKRNSKCLAELLKKSALQSLTVAANVCKSRGLPTELPRQIGARKIELPTQLPGQLRLPRQNGLLGQNGLSAAQSPGVGLTGQNRLSIAQLLRQLELPRQNGLQRQIEVSLPVSVRAKEVLGNIPADYSSRRTVRIQYY